MNMDVTAVEAGLGMFVRYKKKADFIGKEALLKAKKETLKRNLVMMSVEVDDCYPEANESVWLEDHVIIILLINYEC